MKKAAFFSLLGLITLIAVAAVTAGQQREVQEDKRKAAGQAAVRINVQQIRVDVTVRDRDDNLVTGLTKEHFKLYEEKVAQEITYFEPVDGPMTAVLVTEFSRVLPWEWLYEAWLGSYSFVQQMKEGDYLAAVAYDIRPEILADFTQNKSEVYNALRRLNTPGFRESNLYDAMWDTLDRLQEVDGRVAIVLLATGLDTFSKINLDTFLKKVRHSNVVIYCVSLGGNLRARADQYFGSSTRMSLLQADNVLKTIARETGGEAFFPRFTTQYSGIFSTIALLLRNQYALGYVSTNTEKDDDEFRKIKVEVNVDIDGDGKRTS